MSTNSGEDQTPPADAKETRSSIKFVPYIPPRIDNDSFQADVPMLLGSAPPKAQRPREWYQSTRAIHRPDIVESPDVLDFLAFARNLSENILTEEGKRWTPSSSREVPLESDELALEYLCRHNYDVPLAKFKLMCELANGKDVLQTQAMLDKYSHLPSLPTSWWISGGQAYGVMKESSDSLGRRYVSYINDGKAEIAAENSGPTSEDPPPQSTKNSDRKAPRTNPKHAIRKKWDALRKRLDAMLHAVHGSDHKQPIEDILRLIFDASLIEPLVENPGETFISTVNSDLTELQRLTAPAKMWVATLHDMIGNMGPATPQDFTKLKHHLQEADSLAVKCNEERIMKNFLSNYNSWNNSVKEVLSGGGSPEEPVGDVGESGEGSAGKTELTVVNSLLKQTLLFPVRPALLEKLEQLYFDALSIAHILGEFIERAILMSSRRSGRQSKLTEESARALLRRIQECPFKIDRTNELEAMISICTKWKEGVQEALNSDNNTVSLKTVEVFMSEGDKLPFQYPAELSALRERRVLAKAWLDKLKKSFLKTSRSTRKTEGDSEKLSLEQMRVMVQEGSALYENAPQNKELKKANDVVKEADGWMSKAKDLIGEGDAASQDDLQGLLEQANCMPIALDEADYLRAHLKALQWAERAGPMLEGDSIKFSELQKLNREIIKIRAAAYPELEVAEKGMHVEVENEFYVKLPEERKLESVISTVEAWLSTVKQYFHSGVVKKGTTLENLIGIYEQSKLLLPVTVEHESRHLIAAIQAAEGWVEEWAATLDQLGITRSTFRTVLSEEKSVSAPSAAEEEGDEMEITEERGNGLPFKQFARLVSAAKDLIVDFPELRLARDRSVSINDWIARVKKLCPVRVLKRRSGINVGLQKMIYSGVDAFIVDENQEENSIDDASEDDMEYDYDEDSLVIPNHICTTELTDLISEPASFLVDVSEETSRLEDMKIAAGEWDGQMKDHFEGTFSAKLEAVAKRYGNCCRCRATEFPALRKFEKEKNVDGVVEDLSLVTEDKCWDSFEECVKDLLELVEQGEATGVYSATRLKCYSVILLYRWLISARQHLLVAYHWGDMQKSGPRRLLEEIKIVFKADQRDQWNDRYDDTYFSPTNTMSIDDIDDYATSRKRKRLGKDGLSVEPEYVTSSGRHVSATRPATPTPDGEIESSQDNKGGAKKRRKNGDGSSSTATAAVSGSSSSNSRKRSRVSATAQAISEISIEGAEGEKVDVSGDVAATELVPVEQRPAPSILETSFANFNNDISLRCLKRIVKLSAETIPADLLRVIDFYVRALLLLTKRIDETAEWAANLGVQQDAMLKKSKSKSRKECTVSVDNSENAVSAFSEDEDYKAILEFEAEAELKDLCCAKRDALRDQIKVVSDWVTKSDEILSGQTKETVDDLQLHIKAGEKMPFSSTAIVSRLKRTLREANTWISKYEEFCGDDDGKGGVVNMKIKELMELLHVSEDIKGVDLTDFTSYIERVGEVYCLCRIATHGVMIECEHCNEWYHNECLGLTPSQIEKYEADQFKCPRCILIDSFNSTAKNCADIVSLWMNPEQLEKNKQLKSSRIERRFSKYQKDGQALQTEKAGLLAAHDAVRIAIMQGASTAALIPVAPLPGIGALVSQQEVASASVTPDPATESGVAQSEISTVESTPQPASIPEAVTSTVATAPTAADLLKCETSLREIDMKIKQNENNQLKVSQERHDFHASRAVNDPAYQAVLRDWAASVSNILWPGDVQQESRGHPVYTSGLSIAVQEAIERAHSLNILGEVDVQTIIGELHAMNWYYRALCTLQCPPTSKVLRKLITDPLLPRNQGDKSIKFLSATLSRISAWKGKVRRILSSNTVEGRPKKKAAMSAAPLQQTHSDTTDSVQVNRDDISALYLEGTTIPVNSRIVAYLFSVLESSRDEVKEPARKKKRKEKDENTSTAAATGGKSKKIVVPVSLADCPNSSGEESEDETTTSMTRRKAVTPYRVIPDFQKANIPNIWPPTKIGTKPCIAAPAVPVTQGDDVVKEESAVQTTNDSEPEAMVVENEHDTSDVPHDSSVPPADDVDNVTSPA